MMRSKIFKSVSGQFSGNIFHKVIERSMRSLHDKYFKEIRTFCLYVFHQDGQPLRNYTNTIADNKTQHCHWKSINIQHKTLLAKRKCKIRFLHNMKEYCSYLYIFQLQKVHHQQDQQILRCRIQPPKSHHSSLNSIIQ